jgi:hypothetical protein
LAAAATTGLAAPIDIGSRLEPLVDDYLIEAMRGVVLRLHAPAPRVVAWKAGSDVGKLAQQPIRLRFVMKDADLYSLRFRADRENR